MYEEDFIGTVRQEAPSDSTDVAQDVTNATLQTLGERITDGEASDIAQHLPENVAEPLTDAPSEAEPFPLDEFTRRVSDRAEIDESNVIVYSRAVATALARGAAAELANIREQLPTEFDVIFEPSGPIMRDEFLETVRERANVESRDAAQSVTNTSLRTLGERLSEGEAADLAVYLPDSLAEAILESDDEAAMETQLDDFIQQIAQREDVETEDAKTHAQAVCSTLAETASEREIDAARKQLPDPFGVIFEPPDATNGGP